MGGKRRFLFRNCFLYCMVSFLLTLPVWLTATVFAADEKEADEFTLEEITVTAEKREAELQKVPLDISVVRPDDMDTLGIHTAQDLDKILPDVSTDQYAGSFVTVTMRGVRMEFWNPIHETTTAIHLDGVQLTRINGFNNMFYDLQRLEVLKGPQGTLQGRGSTAGSMNFITQKPILNEFSGNATFEFGDYDLYRTEAAINIPVFQKLAMRFAGKTLQRDGYNDAGFGNEHSWAGRASMTWEPTEKDTIIATFDFEGSEDKGYGQSGHYLATYGEALIYPRTDPQYLPQSWGPTNVIELPWQSRWFMGDNASRAYNDINSWGVMTQWEHELPFAYLTTVFGSRSLHEKKNFIWHSAMLWATSQATPADPTITDPDTGDLIGAYVWVTQPSNTYVVSTTSSHTQSLEIRLLSKTTINQGDKLEWILGGMGQDDRMTEVNETANTSHVEVQTKVKAVFTQASYEIFKDFRITGGYRFGADDKIYDGNTDSAVITDEYPLNHKKYGYDNDIWKANLSYQFTEDIMTYVQYSKGFKTLNVDYNGNYIPPEKMNSWEMGFRSRLFSNRVQLNANIYFYEYKNYSRWANVYWCAQDTNSGPRPGANPWDPPDVPGDHNCDDIAGEVTEDNPDGGPDGTVNYLDYMDESSETIGISAGSAEQKGLNANIMWMITQNDTFSINGAWSHNEYKEYDIGQALRDAYADHVYGIPDNVYTSDAYKTSQTGLEFNGPNLRGTINYTHTMWLGMDMTSLNINARYEGEDLDQFIDRGEATQYTMPGRPDYWVLNAAINYSSSRWVPEGMRWNARLWCNNLTDSKHLASLSYSNDFWGIWVFKQGSGTATGGYIEPRTTGVTLTLNF